MTAALLMEVIVDRSWRSVKHFLVASRNVKLHPCTPSAATQWYAMEEAASAGHFMWSIYPAGLAVAKGVLP